VWLLSSERILWCADSSAINSVANKSLPSEFGVESAYWGTPRALRDVGDC
jgi:hypothetical protein